MKRIIAIMLMLASIICIQGTAFAEVKDQDANNGKAMALINKITSGDVVVVQHFSSLGGIEGYVVKAKEDGKQKAIIYVDKDAKFAFVGALFNADGVNQSDIDNQKYIMGPVARDAFGDAGNTAWVLDGDAKAKKVIYVVGDPNCVYCEKFYKDARPFVKNGDVALRWIWVGFLKPSSAGKAQAILAAKDPSKLIAQNEEKFVTSTEDGGLKPLTDPSKEVLEKFNKNMGFMEKYGFPGTPVLIYKDKDGNAKTLFGVPNKEQMKDLIDNLQETN